MHQKSMFLYESQFMQDTGLHPLVDLSESISALFLPPLFLLRLCLLYCLPLSLILSSPLLPRHLATLCLNHLHILTHTLLLVRRRLIVRRLLVIRRLFVRRRLPIPLRLPILLPLPLQLPLPLRFLLSLLLTSLPFFGFILIPPKDLALRRLTKPSVYKKTPEIAEPDLRSLPPKRGCSTPRDRQAWGH